MIQNIEQRTLRENGRYRLFICMINLDSREPRKAEDTASRFFPQYDGLLDISRWICIYVYMPALLPSPSRLSSRFTTRTLKSIHSVHALISSRKLMKITSSILLAITATLPLASGCASISWLDCCGYNLRNISSFRFSFLPPKPHLKSACDRFGIRCRI